MVFFPGVRAPAMSPETGSVEILLTLKPGNVRGEAVRLMAGVQTEPVKHLCVSCLECDPPEYTEAVVCEVETHDSLCAICEEIAADTL